MKRREYNPKTSNKDCKNFVNYIDEGKGNETYTLLKKNPNLIYHLRIYEIPIYYENLLSQVGEKKANYFFIRFMKIIMPTIMEDIPTLHELNEFREKKNLESLLENISNKAKKMLEEMDEN